MRSLRLVLPFIVLTVLCWGNYGPLMHEGQHGMGGSSLRPFVCVGLAYFLIAVVVPLIVLKGQGEKGHWTLTGTIWSLLAGAVGAIGALGIIMAFKFRGSPVYVMPLVFGCAPVVNTLVTMWMAKTYREAGPLFFGGVILVASGAAGVLFFKPAATNVEVREEDGKITVVQTNVAEGSKATWEADNLAALQANQKAYKLYLRKKGPSLGQSIMILASITMTALCWGSYGPVLHKGQMKMAGSRLRPFLCVGLAYFAIAVVVPLLVLSVWAESGTWFSAGEGSLTRFAGGLWSLGAGAAGAVGALGIILAFNFGGKPLYVMPLVFGGAPVINTFTTIIAEGTYRQVTTPFVVSLLIVIIGAVTVLVFAPRAHPPKPAAETPPPAAEAAQEAQPAADTAKAQTSPAAPASPK